MTLPFGRRLQKVISGGQTGADRTGLECAQALGLETGGTVPKGWRTDEGPDPSLAAFGCVEHESSEYPPRTIANVMASDVTVWFGKTNSAGYRLTAKACRMAGVLMVVNPTNLRPIANLYRVMNVAGNRRKKNPAVVGLVREAFRSLE